MSKADIVLLSIGAGCLLLPIIIMVISTILTCIKSFKKIVAHIKRWNKWRKRNVNGKLHKIMVLLGLVHSPSMALILEDEDIERIQKAVMRLEETNNER